MKILKKIEGTIKDQIKSHLKPIENDINNPNKLAFKKIGFSNKTILEANEILNRIKGLGNKTDYTKLFCVNTNGKIFDFNIFQKQRDFIRSLYYADVLIKQAMDQHDKMEALLRDLDAYRSQNKSKKQSRRKTVDSAHKIFKGREIIIDAFENSLLPLPKKPPSFWREDKDKEFVIWEERSKYNVNEFNKLLAKKEKITNKELFQKNFNF